MKDDVNGTSSCLPGEEKYERFTIGKTIYTQYDYRNTKGELFSTVACSPDECRKQRDKWLRDKI